MSPADKCVPAKSHSFDTTKGRIRPQSLSYSGPHNGSCRKESQPLALISCSTLIYVAPYPRTPLLHSCECEKEFHAPFKVTKQIVGTYEAI